ncbi:MarR family winged helix-turn-helix transcriptional regulator [Thermoflexibacter ruber]|uniref:DNA-binding transcriptional regulator, MarR family n=1 Tax=Thermoflexibacter ruber TaxID=1003 RepID=A0A1I2FJU1_9BACT|nr:MarR family winged helix-turn-helix transcriptional regulator [Thermoflexibacter ruber]SFF05048.1 DNA-binding transcriptional regulator, MarR family [Thermoflexibacter ruber]
MKIEEAIQGRFRNDKHKLGVNLIYTANWYMDKLDSIFKSEEITHQQFNILRILRGAYPKPVTIKYIRERMLDKMSDVSRIVEKLREKGYLCRQECPNDRRNVDITITEKGLAELKKIDSLIEPLESIFDIFSPLEITMFNELLDKLRSSH